MEWKRAVQTNRKLAQDFLDKLASIVKKYHVRDPDIWNMDQTGFMIGSAMGAGTRVVLPAKDKKRLRQQALIQESGYLWSRVSAPVATIYLRTLSSKARSYLSDTYFSATVSSRIGRVVSAITVGPTSSSVLLGFSTSTSIQTQASIGGLISAIEMTIAQVATLVNITVSYGGRKTSSLASGDC